MNENTEMIIPEQEQAPVSIQTKNILLDVKQLKLLDTVAKRYSSSDMVPQNYKGRPDNCFVAIELATRMAVSPVLVMQNLYIVQGKPSWAGQACKALIDGSGKFKDSEYVMTGSAEDGTRGCYLQAVHARTGKLVKGTEITLQMAQDEGWSTKSGSKWKTMPEQMLKYRAAAFFARTECPECLMGFQTADEIEDVHGTERPEEKVTIEIGA